MPLISPKPPCKSDGFCFCRKRANPKHKPFQARQNHHCPSISHFLAVRLLKKKAGYNYWDYLYPFTWSVGCSTVPSSNTTYLAKTMPPYNIVIFIDIPDPDNILMVLDVLRRHPQEHIAIVLSPRIVDLSAPRYGDNFGAIKKQAGFEIKEMALPIESDEKKIPEGLESWFYKDGTNADLEIRADSELYVRVSMFRLIEILQDYGLSSDRYSIFWDEQSLKTPMRPDMRHAFHVHDFTYNFNKKEMDMYKRNIENVYTRSHDLRKKLRRVIHIYMDRQRAIHVMEEVGVRLCSFEHLLKANEQLNDAFLIVGGPFTEALAYLKRTRNPKRIVAMGASLTNDRNIFGAQFNIWKDPKAAKEFFELVSDRQIQLYMVPTECVKGAPGKPCPFELGLEEYKQILKEDSLLYRAIKQYTEDTGRDKLYPAFDWVTAIAATHLKIFRWNSVTLDKEKGSGSIGFRNAKGTATTIRIARNDDDSMRRNREWLINLMKETAGTSVM